MTMIFRIIPGLYPLVFAAFLHFDIAYSFLPFSHNLLTGSPSSRTHNQYDYSSPIIRYLLPLAQVHDISFLSSLNFDDKGMLKGVEDNVSNWTLYIAEEEDLPAIAKLIVDTFGADVITLSGDLSSFERAFLNSGVSAWNSYAGAVAYVDVLNGLRQRSIPTHSDESLLSPPPIVNVSSHQVAEKIAAKSSIFLALGRIDPNHVPFPMDIAATVELRLQPTDAKIPFSQPWIDHLERNLATCLGISTETKDSSLQPYLSNLCVSSNVRRRNIGKALVRCVESIAKDAWGYSKLYLHVDSENIPAMKLYTGQGYHDVNIRWKPFWAESPPSIPSSVIRQIILDKYALGLSKDDPLASTYSCNAASTMAGDRR